MTINIYNNKSYKKINNFNIKSKSQTDQILIHILLYIRIRKI